MASVQEELADGADVSRGPGWLRVAVTLVVAAAAVASLFVIGYRGAYGQWPWAPYPTIISACDRDYHRNPGGQQTREQITAQGYELVRHGTTSWLLSRKPLWTFGTVDGQATDAVAGNCHVSMWIQGGTDSFHGYDLEGGP